MFRLSRTYIFFSHFILKGGSPCDGVSTLSHFIFPTLTIFVLKFFYEVVKIS